MSGTQSIRVVEHAAPPPYFVARSSGRPKFSFSILGGCHTYMPAANALPVQANMRGSAELTSGGPAGAFCARAAIWVAFNAGKCMCEACWGKAVCGGKSCPKNLS